MGSLQDKRYLKTVYQFVKLCSYSPKVYMYSYTNLKESFQGVNSFRVLYEQLYPEHFEPL